MKPFSNNRRKGTTVGAAISRPPECRQTPVLLDAELGFVDTLKEPGIARLPVLYEKNLAYTIAAVMIAIL